MKRVSSGRIWTVRCICCFAWCVTALHLHAQQSRLHRYGIEAGLPSSHVYCVSLDDEGQIWAGTESGVVRYDGFSFTVFDHSSGLPQNDVFNIVDDGSGKIWLRSLNHLSYLQDGKIHSGKTPFDPSHQVTAFSFCGESLYVATSKPNSLWIYHADNWSQHTLDTPPAITNIFRYDGQTWAASPQLFFSLDGPARSFPCSQNGEMASFSVVVPGLGVVMQIGKQLFAFQGDRMVRLFPRTASGELLGQVLSAYCDREGYLWLSISGEGVFRYAADELMGKGMPVAQYLRDEEVNWMVEDAEGGMWFSTAGSGLMYISRSAFSIAYADESDGLGGKSVEALAVHPSGELLIAHENYQITRWQRSGMPAVTSLASDCRVCRIRSLSLFTPELLVVGTNRGLFLQYAGTAPEMISIGSVKFSHVQNGDLWVGTYAQLLRVPRDRLQAGKPFQADTIFAGRCYAASPDTARQAIWIGTNQGLWRKDLATGELTAPADPRLQTGILTLVPDAQNRLWIGTDGSGLLVMEDDFLYQVTTTEGLPSNIVRQVLHDSSGATWLATPRGLGYLPAGSDLDAPRLQDIRGQQGLPSSEIQALAVQGGELLVGTARGLARVPLTYFADLPAPELQVKLTGLRIAGRDTALLRSYALQHQQNEIEVRYTARYLAAQGNLQFRYRLRGLNQSDWTQTSLRRVQYRSLPPGDYRFDVQARVPGGSWSASATTALTIAQPFFRRTWFRLLAAVALLLLVAGLAGLRIRQVRRRERRRSALLQQVTESRLQALRAQMNPHFIFNALAAVQHFITTHDERAAHKYLTTFSRLVRRVLENSRVGFIALEEEVETLRLYLNLEHLRFRNLFDFELVVAPDLQGAGLEVPPMLVQPFIENAVRHGLRHKADKGQLRVRFYRENELVCCVVEDDGIGRDAAGKLKRQRSGRDPSRGMDISGARLDAAQGLSAEAARFEIEDLRNAEGRARGTRVTLWLPTQKMEVEHVARNHR